MSSSELHESSGFHLPVDFAVIGILGKGTYGLVACCVNKCGTKYALKKVDPKEKESSLREIQFLEHFTKLCSGTKALAHVVELINSYEHQKFDYIMLEYMETDLGRIIHSKQKLTPIQIMYILIQILQGIRIIHAAQVVHRDIKPANLLLNSDCYLKIADFGLSRKISVDEKAQNDSSLSQYVATRWYRAPEVLLEGRYSFPMDMWSIGCIFAELIQREAVFKGQDETHQMACIIGTIGTPTVQDIESVVPRDLCDVMKRHFFNTRMRFTRSFRKVQFPLEVQFRETSSLARNLLEALLTFNQDQRITAADALQHIYFQPICWFRKDLIACDMSRMAPFGSEKSSE